MSHNPADRSWINSFYDSAAEWWGESWYDGEDLKPRLERVQRFAGGPPRKLLELGAGTGETGAYLAAHGYEVTAVDISDRNCMILKRIESECPGFAAIQGDFYTAAIPGRFDAVCLFETFGMGTDKEQRSLLRRISSEWLLPSGIALMDVYHPFGPIKRAGTAKSLDRLENIPGSVAMTERCFYDAVLGRWVDVWEPVNQPGNARVQSVRCYTPADFLLLLEGTGLRVQHADFLGEAFEMQPSAVSATSPMHEFEKNHAYSVVLVRV